MFDIGFSEILMLLFVGLVVLGPKRLPVAIRTVMGWVRTIRGLAANVQNELAQELKLQELQDSIKKAEQFNLSQLSPELEQTVADLKESAQKIKADLEKKAAETQTSFEQQAQQLKEAIHQPSAEQTEKTPEISTALSAAEQAELAELAEENVQAEKQAMAEMLSKYAPTEDSLANAEPVNQEVKA